MISTTEYNMGWGRGKMPGWWDQWAACFESTSYYTVGP